MKKITTVLSLILVLNCAYSQTEYLKYPSYKQVVTKFFSEYSAGNPSQTSQLSFEKKPSGWYVAINDYASGRKTIKEELFWVRASNKFLKIKFPTINDEETEDNKTQLNKFLTGWDKDNYSFCPYYGYSGWDWDVIQEYKDYKNLPDSIVYALGRAYSSFASNMLSNNTGFADSTVIFKLPEGKNCMSIEQLSKYRKYRHLAIETFKKVNELNPNFETVIGTIENKLSNEYMVSFLDLRTYQNEEEANKEIIPGLYIEFYISAAKNYLNSCAPNGIIFTNGDNDTYPLLYVQAEYGFRKDVMVVNMSLLQTSRYINSLREKILDAPPLPITFTPEQIKEYLRDIVFIQKENSKPMQVSKMIEFIKKDENTLSYGTDKYFYIPTNKFSLDYDGGTMDWDVIRQYFYKNNLILLDILANNKWKRPLYFAITLQNSDYIGLDNFLQLDGMAYRLNPNNKDFTENEYYKVNSTVLYDNLTNKFDWKGITKINVQEEATAKNYLYLFSQLGLALIKDNKLDSAKLVLDKCVELFPNEIMPYDYFMSSIITCYYKLGFFENGNAIAKKLISNLNNDIGFSKDWTIQEKKDRKEYTINFLKSIAEEYKQDEIIKEIEK